MHKKLVLALLVALLAAGGVFLMLQGERGGGRGVREEERVRAPEPAPLPLERGEVLASVEERVAAPERAAVGSTTPTSMRGELAGLVGRLVEPDGRPIPGMRVALLEFEAGILFDAAGLDEPERSLELEETVTNAEGRFVLNGARASAIHALGIDLGGPRATFRVLDHGLVHRERVDIGDVVLAPYGVLTGRVLDDDGAPLAGARVRVAPLPAEVLQGQPQDFRPESLVAVSMTPMGGQGHLVIELPGWVRSAIERFPIPTTESRDDGTFRLEGVPLTNIVVGIDRRGLVGANAGPIDMSGGLHDLGDVVLKRGRTVTGVVEDDSGDPVAGVEVFAGAELVPGIAAMLQPAGLSDENGEFRLEGVYETGNIVATARRSRSEAWKTSVSPRADGILIELGSLVTLTVNVRNPAGQPLSGVDLRVAPARPRNQMSFFDVTAFLPRPPTPTGTFSEVEPGRYVNAKLGAGTYEVAARQAGFAPGFLEANCQAETTELTLTMPTGRRLEVTVVDAASKAPVADSQVNVMRASGAGFTKLAARRTGEDGLAVLGPLPDLPPAKNEGFMPDTTLLQVQHPRYGEHATTLAPDVTSLVIELEPGGTLTGKVHWGGAVPTRLYMLTLEFRGADDFLELFHLPRFTVTDLAGEFRLTNLVPGKYQAALSERFLQTDPLAMMSESFEPPTLHREELEIRNGETTELVIDLTPSGRGATARIRGHVRYDGRNLAGAKVRFSGNGSVELETDAVGRFESPELPCSEDTYVRITAELAIGNQAAREVELFGENIELQRDEVRELALDLYPIALRARVIAESGGEPIADASVGVTLQKENRGWRRDENWTTNSSGEAELFVLEPGRYAISAQGGGFTRATEMVDVPAEGLTAPVVLRLSRSVPCAGRIEFDPSFTQGAEGWSYLWVRSEQGNTSGTQIEPADQTFTLENLPPGKYTAQLFMRGQRGQEVEFELGPAGDENLVLVFLPATEEEEE